MAIEKIDQEQCLGCGQCYEVCYADVIRFDANARRAEAKYPQDCAMCCWCVALCPAGAILFTLAKTVPVFTSWG